MGQSVNQADAPTIIDDAACEFFATHIVRWESVAGNCLRLELGVCRHSEWHITGSVIIPIELVKSIANSAIFSATEALIRLPDKHNH